jgi:hypothetical protein
VEALRRASVMARGFFAEFSWRIIPVMVTPYPKNVRLPPFVFISHIIVARLASVKRWQGCNFYG